MRPTSPERHYFILEYEGVMILCRDIRWGCCPGTSTHPPNRVVGMDCRCIRSAESLQHSETLRPFGNSVGTCLRDQILQCRFTSDLAISTPITVHSKPRYVAEQQAEAVDLKPRKPRQGQIQSFF